MDRAATAAVGSLLLGAGPFTAIGKVTTLSDAWWAFLALVVALAGVGIGIWFTADRSLRQSPRWPC